MAKSTGIVLTATGITFANDWYVKNEQNYRVLFAGLVAAGFLALVEHVSETLAVGLASISLVTVLVAPVTDVGQTPVQSLAKITGGKS